MKTTTLSMGLETAVSVPLDGVRLEGGLAVPENAAGMVVFAHGSGSSRHSPRNRHVAEVLQQGGLATLLFDLLTPKEEVFDARTAALRFDADMLARRLLAATDWLARRPRVGHLKIGYFGASSGAGAALVAAAGRPDAIGAVVSRGGRPDLAGEALTRVTTPVLLIVGENDRDVLALNREAMQRLAGPKRLEVVPGATHLFEEPGALEEVARLACDWFLRYLVPEEVGAVRKATGASR